MDPNTDDLCHSRVIHQERIELARQTALSPLEYEKLANLFKVMGDPTRLRILFALSGEEMCVCDLAAYLDISESAVSHQLRNLRQHFLVTNRRQGPILYYRLNDDHINQLIRIGLDHSRE
ncbi:MAG: metalloregulator ArsR/SmtB family transcription factor [Proteobacteria bacterium]|nr:metalloregulator ArsR/SmtB family transcription factor [Pseudomonadota bacterium]MBU1686839.1 metalloregulator ArsR/SmtB family transcription factor [Pseudomonadota bacterium]